MILEELFVKSEVVSKRQVKNVRKKAVGIVVNPEEVNAVELRQLLKEEYGVKQKAAVVNRQGRRVIIMHSVWREANGYSV